MLGQRYHVFNYDVGIVHIVLEVNYIEVDNMEQSTLSQQLPNICACYLDNISNGLFTKHHANISLIYSK